VTGESKKRLDLAEEVLDLKVLKKLSDFSRNAILSFTREPKNRWHERSCTIALFREMPLVVHIQAPVAEPLGYRWYARPVWSRQSLRKRTFKITVRSTYQHDFSTSKYWFLLPAYRKGHRPALLLKDGEFLKPCFAYEHRPLTIQEIDEMRFAASTKFEDLVRRFLQAYLPWGLQVQSRSKPETDWLIDLNERGWVGEIKFTETDVLSAADADTAIRQVHRNAEAWDSSKPIGQVIVTNASRIPETLVEWSHQGVDRDIWIVRLRETAKDFVATGDGAILSMERAVQIGEHQLQIDGEYLRNGDKLRAA